MRKIGRPLSFVEMLVVMAILAVLLSLLLPGMRKARGMAISLTCQNNLRQAHGAFVLYADDHYDSVPRPVANDLFGASTGRLTSVNPDAPPTHVAINWGRLYAAGYIENPKIYYCPNLPEVWDTYKGSFTGADRWLASAPGWIDSGYPCRIAGWDSSSVWFERFRDWSGRCIVGDRAGNDHEGTGWSLLYQDGHTKLRTNEDWENQFSKGGYAAWSYRQNHHASYHFWKIADDLGRRD